MMEIYKDGENIIVVFKKKDLSIEKVLSLFGGEVVDVPGVKPDTKPSNPPETPIVNLLSRESLLKHLLSLDGVSRGGLSEAEIITSDTKKLQEIFLKL